MSELVDLGLHQHAIAHEIYRHQMMQRLPDPYPSMLPVPPPQRKLTMQPHYLSGIDAKLQNSELWSEFHQIGTEMIITKSGRRMFPSLRLSLSGLEDDVNYCILLEMVLIGDCRYKFSGSQWVPAGGAEPQSPQRMYLHQDSPALGSHWQAQPILFNKVKLTNNTLDNNGHIVLTSMHKYQPRIHIIRTTDPSHIPWAPQSAYTFNETEFVAVTAYQNDRITKLKIDNNPFAKGFRETGQSRCKRKNVTVPLTNKQSSSLLQQHHDENSEQDETNVKRLRPDSSACSISSLDDSGLSVSESSSGTCSPATTDDLSMKHHHHHHHHHNHHPDDERILELRQQDILLQQYSNFMNPTWMDLAFSYLSRAPYSYYQPIGFHDFIPNSTNNQISQQSPILPYSIQKPIILPKHKNDLPKSIDLSVKTPKKSSFTISAILGSDR